jgi:hypothetical protein
MKTLSSLRRTLAFLALTLAGLGVCAPPARASINDFIAVYKQIESAAPSGTLPVSSQDIVVYEDLFTCAEGGKDVVDCTYQFHQTHTGQEATADIPEGVWQGAEAYVAWKDGDTWGVVEHLGAAAACAVLQVLAGGYDVCGLIQDLYQAAEDAYDTAKWVAKFFVSLGEGAWSAFKAGACAIGLGGCDSDPPPPPPEVSAYNQFFAPKIKDGSALQARESSNENTFGALLFQASSAAQKKFPFAAVQKASDAFVAEVNKLWTSDIANKVLPALAVKRDTYNNAQKGQNVSAAVKDAGAAYAASKADPREQAIKHCRGDFAEFQHYDYWMAMPEFQSVWKQLGSSPSNETWCRNVFWYKNKDAFAKSFQNYVVVNLCPTFGQQLLCPTLPKYESCLALMGSVGQKSQCGVTVAQAGKDAAQQVDQILHQDTAGIKASKIPCQIFSDSTPLSTKPAQLVCPRPVQQHYCNETYKALFGSLPTKLMDCTPGTVDPNYTSLVSKVQTAISATIPKAHPKAGTLVKDQIDPLIVHATNSAGFDELKKANEGFGFGPPSTKPGFDYVVGIGPPLTKDGVNTPVLFSKEQIKLPVSKAKLGRVMQPDPAMQSKPVDLTAKASGDKLGFAKAPATGGGFVPKSGAGNVALAPGAIGGAGQSLPAPSTPLSGGAPAGLSKGQLAVIGAQVKIESNCHAPQAALTVSVKIRNTGGLPAGGGDTIRVKEIGGATSLGSAGIALPVVKSGETKDLSIPVTSPGPYASLPGAHQLGVYLETQFDKPAAPYQLSVNVPAGHCAQRTTSPAPTRGVH